MYNAEIVSLIAEYFPEVFEPSFHDDDSPSLKIGSLQNKVSKFISFQVWFMDQTNKFPEFIDQVAPSRYRIEPGDNSEQILITLYFDEE